MASVKLSPREEEVYERDGSAISDLVMLEEITGETITSEIVSRYERGDMYTAIGPVLIAVNPYKLLEKQDRSIYRVGVAHHYMDHESLEVEPHVYMIAAVALKGMRSERENQCVLVSGESGAGKTETAKQLMSFVAIISGGGDTLEATKKQLLDSNPVLEGFGNAQTVRNDNSSRFGKYMELSFDFKGDVEGGRVSNYLLEKSRITGHGRGERGFHIFHQLTSGADAGLRESLSGLGTAKEYTYLMNEEKGILGLDDKAELDVWRAAARSVLAKIDYDPEDEMELFSLVAFVLFLGQLEFVDQGSDRSAKAEDPAKLAAAAKLIKADPMALEKALTCRTLTKMRGRSSVTIATLDAAQSAQTATTLAKETYKRLFDWLVQQINLAITPETCVSSIGILDIFGFEIFEQNGFEQFCINYVNEKLQQYFIELTLKAEQEEYTHEGVPWKDIEYFDNRVVCELIESKKPTLMGIFSLLDETATFKGADTVKLMVKLRSNFSEGGQTAHREHFVGSIKKMTDFTIVHYAGSVDYCASDFLEKNADTMFNDLVELMSVNANAQLPKALFTDTRTSAEKAKRPPSVSVQFKGQVNELMVALRACNPNYIRCIKPNDEKEPLVGDFDRIKHQVKYLGLVENVRVRRAGYAYRSDYKRFSHRFKIINETSWPHVGDDPKKASKDIVSGAHPITRWGGTLSFAQPALLKEGTDYWMGKTKVFIKEPKSVFALEMRRKACYKALVAKCVQAPTRMRLAMNLLALCKACVTAMTKVYRGKVARAYKKKAYAAVIKLQSEIRSWHDAKLVKGMKARCRGIPPRVWAATIQNATRAYLARKNLSPEARAKANERMRRVAALALKLKRNNAAKPIQRMIRGFLGPKRLARKEREEFKRVKAQLNSGLTLVRHAKGSVLKPSAPKPDCLLYSTEGFTVKGRSLFGAPSGKLVLLIGNVSAVTKCGRRRAMPGAIFLKSIKAGDGVNLDMCLVVSGAPRAKDELALQLPSVKARDELYRAVHILKYGTSNHTWSMKHARQKDDAFR